jgi:hypothetical protein
MKLYIISSIVLLSIIASALSFSCRRDCVSSKDYEDEENGGDYEGTWCMLKPGSRRHGCRYKGNENSCDSTSGCVWTYMEDGTYECQGVCQACCTYDEDEDTCVKDNTAGEVSARCRDLRVTRRKRKLRKF